ncbi:hypothetical protein P389DRAFT_172301 [Cystobasidium minutum MCA 4210]|uniref:uncharacterized protein n=1 Tax=Cystobasidium minutum MCA 4210 TaxID=1397322 RepID=UPI0034CE7806|eukprot:jgi/Rhomi1/172301/fgenesh1_kg.5_\
MAASVGDQSTQVPSSSRLSIYDSPGAPILLVPEPPSALQLQISSVRKAAQSVYSDLSVKARRASDQWIGAEHKLEHELSSLRARDEPLTPGAFYVGISTLFGSILTRNRLFPLRIITPPAFLIASTAYFLPKHFDNVTTYTAALEKSHTPELYKAQLQLAHNLEGVRARTAALIGQASQKTNETAGRVFPWLESTSGLTLTKQCPSQPEREV